MSDTDGLALTIAVWVTTIAVWIGLHLADIDAHPAVLRPFQRVFIAMADGLERAVTRTGRHG